MFLLVIDSIVNKKELNAIWMDAVDWVGKEEDIKSQIWSENGNSWSNGKDNNINWWTKTTFVTFREIYSILTSLIKWMIWIYCVKVNQLILSIIWLEIKWFPSFLKLLSLYFCYLPNLEFDIQIGTKSREIGEEFKQCCICEKTFVTKWK